MRMISRAEWGARAPLYRYTMPWSQVVATFVHYSAGPVSQTPRQIQNFHMDTQGWSDIAYSWLVNQAGDAIEGRGWGVVGGHTKDWNSKSHAICWIGGAGDIPTPAALRTIRELCDEADRLAGRALPRWPHSHVNSTSCCGPALTPWVYAGMPLDSLTPVPEEEPMAYQRLVRAEGDPRVFLTDYVTRRHVTSEADLAALFTLDSESRFLADHQVRVVAADVVESIPLAGAGPAQTVGGGGGGIDDAAVTRIAQAVADEYSRRMAR